MKIVEATGWRRKIGLREPYTIASDEGLRTFDHCDLCFVRLVAEDGTVGLGSGSAGERVTGESADDTATALADLSGLRGLDVRRFGGVLAEVAEGLHATPAAAAAVDMALHDLHTRGLGVPLVDWLGRRGAPRMTSVTLGIESVEASLESARRLRDRGFRCFKVKVGGDAEADEERLTRLRELLGAEALLRIDANEGYDLGTSLRLDDLVQRLDLELVEQPLPRIDPVSDANALRALPESLRRHLAIDESLVAPADALAFVGPPPACGIFNVKLMKCGGVAPALAIARIAEEAGIELMWGCMDESRLSIAAALHAALASPATRYLDLDGSFDLEDDPVTGGFRLVEGVLHLLDAPGLGVEIEGAAS